MGKITGTAAGANWWQVETITTKFSSDQN